MAEPWRTRLARMLADGPGTRAEMIRMLRGAERRGLVNSDALGMIEGALAVAHLQVRDIMIPRTGMVVVERDKKPEEFVATVIESGHSRFPVLGDGRDDVDGILLAKDLLRYFALERGREFDLRDAMRPAWFVPESKRLNVLLKEFQTSRNHMAIVVNEWGGLAGLVTIEDVIEQIVGEIDDEHDVDEESFIEQVEPGAFMVNALMPVEDFNKQFETAFDDGEFDTVGGVVVKAFGYLPERGEDIVLGELRFSVARADRRRVKSFRVVAGG
ncbi:MAG: CBS domain-containing protein [Immundisolibacterales bacterium]|nr:CBS domain-containing protein [Immundisolibacterales bacterium]